MALAQHPSTPHSSLPISPLDFDIAIAGAGIVGLTLACALKDAGLRVAIIEAKPREAGLSQRRAYAITLMSGRIFQGLGVWEQILPHITTFNQIRMADADYSTIVNLKPEDLGTKSLGYVGEHCVLVQALLDKLEGADITWLCPAELVQVDYQADVVALTLAIAGETQTVHTRLLVAADGARSPIRTAAGITTHGWQYWQSCVTAVLRPEKSHENIAREHFWESGPFATLPLPDNRCQIVLTAPHAEAQQLLESSESEFLAELNRRYEGQLGKLELLSPRILFPVQLMQSDRYTQPRLALIGDAAHCCHPVGGQGLNMGIRDAAALAQVLEAAYQRGEDIGKISVLKRYDRWRKLENLAILGFTDLLDRIFSNRWLPLVVIRRLGLRVMQVARPVKFLALWLMTGAAGRHPNLSKR
ncbi:MAG: FAD-dependent hydroxylase [Drouetiella hepatica Uher 2000/2452]|jgi:2-octaprenyl-6-methoxyphenol hydroxylase|uniref:FAD-dependent hydroxylase n=1 Tax=Drouetiella hepatica Uher 2000/2452 TaxID=904376 RepID=A0A951UKC0_9CYAN|nr:FAD-dependent hydroxylase [Drouetiella hepatica Uher 2000/2452]